MSHLEVTDNMNDEGGLYSNNKRKTNHNFGGESNYYSQTVGNGGGSASASNSIMSPHGSNLFNLLLPRENLNFTPANNNTFSGPFINDIDAAQGLNSLTSTDKLLLS